MELRWLEAWVDSRICYVLIVGSLPEESVIQVFDPQENWRSIFKSSDYESVRRWLAEDEYDLIETRWSREAT